MVWHVLFGIFDYVGWEREVFLRVCCGAVSELVLGVKARGVKLVVVSVDVVGVVLGHGHATGSCVVSRYQSIYRRPLYFTSVWSHPDLLRSSHDAHVVSLHVSS